MLHPLKQLAEKCRDVYITQRSLAYGQKSKRKKEVKAIPKMKEGVPERMREEPTCREICEMALKKLGGDARQRGGWLFAGLRRIQFIICIKHNPDFCGADNIVRRGKTSKLLPASGKKVQEIALAGPDES